LDKEKMILKHFELSFLIFLLEEPTKPM
jgi:hypothetical protein